MQKEIEKIIDHISQIESVISTSPFKPAHVEDMATILENHIREIDVCVQKNREHLDPYHRKYIEYIKRRYLHIHRLLSALAEELRLDEHEREEHEELLKSSALFRKKEEKADDDYEELQETTRVDRNRIEIDQTPDIKDDEVAVVDKQSELLPPFDDMELTELPGTETDRDIFKDVTDFDEGERAEEEAGQAETVSSVETPQKSGEENAGAGIKEKPGGREEEEEEELPLFETRLDLDRESILKAGAEEAEEIAREEGRGEEEGTGSKDEFVIEVQKPEEKQESTEEAPEKAQEESYPTFRMVSDDMDKLSESSLFDRTVSLERIDTRAEEPAPPPETQLQQEETPQQPAVRDTDEKETKVPVEEAGAIEDGAGEELLFEEEESKDELVDMLTGQEQQEEDADIFFGAPSAVDEQDTQPATESEEEAAVETPLSHPVEQQVEEPERKKEEEEKTAPRQRAEKKEEDDEDLISGDDLISKIDRFFGLEK
jgi:hypothetical protein